MSEVVVLSQNPSVLLFRDFISKDEQRHVIELAEKRHQKSTVIDNDTGDSIATDYRTGFMSVLANGETPTLRILESRIAGLTYTRVCQGEAFQVIGYKRGEQYKKHNDWFDPAFAANRRHFVAGGQRVKTVMIYLRAPDKGGETEFVNLGFRVRPEERAALVWDNVLANGAIDHRVLHAGLPVKKGEKIIMNRWIRERAFDGSENSLTPEQLREKLCAEDIQRILMRHRCRMVSKAVIVGGKILAESRVFSV